MAHRMRSRQGWGVGGGRGRESVGSGENYLKKKLQFFMTILANSKLVFSKCSKHISLLSGIYVTNKWL